MTMTIGEVDFNSVFRQFPGGAEDGDTTEEIPFPEVSYLLWVAFLIMMPVILMNLLVNMMMHIGNLYK